MGRAGWAAFSDTVLNFPAARVNSLFILERLRLARVFRCLRFAGRRIFLGYSVRSISGISRVPGLRGFEVFLSPHNVGCKSHFSGVVAESPRPRILSFILYSSQYTDRSALPHSSETKCLKNYHL